MKQDLPKLQAYLRKLFGNNLIRVVAPALAAGLAVVAFFAVAAGAVFAGADV